MRGSDSQNGLLFSYVNLEERVPARHPLRKIKIVVDAALNDLDANFAALYAVDGRPGIAPERLLRAALVQILFSIRSETQLMEQMQYNLLFRWFVGLSVDDPVWVPTVFTKNRDRLLNTEIAQKLMAAILAHEKVAPLLSDEHFSVDGTLVEAPDQIGDAVAAAKAGLHGLTMTLARELAGRSITANAVAACGAKCGAIIGSNPCPRARCGGKPER